MEVRLAGLLCTFVLLFAVLSAINVNTKLGAFEDTYGDYLDADNETIATEHQTREFLTKPQIFTARIGEIVRLPCEINDTNNEQVSGYSAPSTFSDMAIVWKKDGGELLYVDYFAIKIFPNIKKTTEGLEINVTSNRDYGQYACYMMMTATDSKKIIHTIVPPVSPVITSIGTLNNKTVFNVGDTLELTCISTGHPQPKVSWYKGSKRIESSGENITILNLKPHNAGIYRCLADNDVKPPAHGHIEINIEHQPIVTIDRYLINSNKEKDVELKCTVHAYPPPLVKWQKDGINIKADPPRVLLKMHQNNVENILLIQNLTDADFGKYTCSAINRFRKVEKTVSIVKVPVMQGFLKAKPTNKDVVLTWKVQSKAPITEHQLQYRKKGEEEWKNIKPEVEEKDIYVVKYTLKGLEPGSYETRVRSQNVHGWSDYSDILPFKGEKHAVAATPAPRQKTESPVGGNT